MPKRGGRGNMNGPGGSRFVAFNDLDDRDDRERDRDRERERERDNPPKGRNTRRVSFKPSLLQSSGIIRRRMAEIAIRSHLEDDEDMGDMPGTSKPEHARRKGSPIPRKKFGNLMHLSKSPFGWYQITINNGQRYAKEELVSVLQHVIAPEHLMPLYWRSEKNYVTFFVDDHRVAERLDGLERAVQMPDGFRPYLRVRAACPSTPVNDQLKARMQVVMAKRYNAHTKALDMSSFHTDPDFKGIFCGVFRTPVMAAAIEIMEKNIPDLVALNLNNNNISSMEAFKNAHVRLPNLRILYLADNRIPTATHLIALRHVPFVELALKNNGLCSRYKDHAQYVREIQRKFPKLKKLDGEELTPMIQFDVGEEAPVMPQAKASFLCDPNGTDIIRQFLEQYFLIFDSDNRQPLLDAYHDQAMLSLIVPPASQVGRLEKYWRYNRSLLRQNADDNIRLRLLRYGRLAVVSMLAELPKTKHYPRSFTVDLTLFTPKMIVFTVAGLFKDIDEDSEELRYFQRQYIIVPAGSGFCIRNEMVLITVATQPQIRFFKKSIEPATTTHMGNEATVHSPGLSSSLQSRLQVNQPSTSAVAAATLQPPQMGVDEATKIQMVQTLSAQSNMNIEWSKKCLEETNWDYNHAAFVFDKLHKENKIPPEAFVK
ncbi:PREDICTED: nuclear RNA export factor 1 [Rhagoletis zephyria]|uniref:nuclear RNA export factor 1 n=1 Tax=Rhagoletis zephyria TaxID=28612 RepID=UPI0008117878|nr:PREDICTED: nuclear RNA export factor 1 [Rhagoletis zephyria]